MSEHIKYRIDVANNTLSDITSNTVTLDTGAFSVNGDLSLYNTTRNTIYFRGSGLAAPSFTNRSVGTKIVLHPNIGASSVDYGIGIESSNLWFSIGNTSAGYKWYGGTTLAMSLSGTGNLTTVGDISSKSLLTTNGNIGISNTLADAFANQFFFNKSRSGAAVQVGDEIGYFSWNAMNTTPAISRGAYLIGNVDAVYAGIVSARLGFVTTNSAGASGERLRISGEGNVTIYKDLKTPGTFTTNYASYPPGALTAATITLTNQLYGNGVYIASSSSNLAGWPAQNAFNNVVGDEGWHSAGGTYTSSTGIYAGAVSTTISGTAVLGEWIQLQLPLPISIEELRYTGRTGYLTNRMPRSFVLAGSNDGTTWTSVYTETALVNTTADRTFVVNSAVTFSYFRLVVREVGNSTTGGTAQDVINISEIKFISDIEQHIVIATSDSVSTGSGALQVAGGAGIGKNLYIGGNVSVRSSSNPHIRLAHTSNGGETSILFTSTNDFSNTSGSNWYLGHNIGGIGAGNFGLFSAAISGSIGNVISFTPDGTTKIYSTNESSGSTNSGALQVAGGAGIAKSLYVGTGINAIQTHASGTTVNQLITRFDANWGMRLVQNFAGAGDIYYQWYNTYTVGSPVERLWLTVRNDTTTLSSPFVSIPNTLTLGGALSVNNNVTITPVTPTTLSGFKVELTGSNFSVYRSGADTLMQNTGSSNIGTPNNFLITSTTSSSGVGTGALQISGGAYIAGTSYVNGPIITATTMGQALPSFTTRSTGSRLIFYPAVSASTVDWGYGLGPNTMWASLGASYAAATFKWYGGTTQIMQLDGLGNLYVSGSRQGYYANTGGWYRVGRVDGTEGTRFKITVLGCAGYNSNTTTGGESVIVCSINNSWLATATTTNIAGYYYVIGPNGSVLQNVKFVQNGTNRGSYFIYASLPGFPSYSIHCDTAVGQNWTPEFTAVADPGVDSATVQAAQALLQVRTPTIISSTLQVDSSLFATGSLVSQCLLGNNFTQAPNDTLYVGSSTAGNVFLDREIQGGTFVFGYNTPKNAAGSKDIIQIFNNSTDRNALMTIASAGATSGTNSISMYVPVNMNSSVSIGTTVSFNNLNTAGIRFLNGVTVDSTIYEDGNLHIGTNDNMYFDTPIGTARMQLTTTGATINGNLAVTNNLNVTGRVWSTVSNGFVNLSSDVATYIGNSGDGANYGQIQVYGQSSLGTLGGTFYGLNIQTKGGALVLGSSGSTVSLNGNLVTFGTTTLHGIVTTNLLKPSYIDITSGNGQILNLYGTDHAYMAFYPQGSAGGRKGYFGYTGAGLTRLTMNNSAGDNTIQVDGQFYASGYAILGSTTNSTVHTIQGNGNDILTIRNYNTAGYASITFVNHDASKAAYFGLGGTTATGQINKMYLNGTATDFNIGLPVVINGLLTVNNTNGILQNAADGAIITKGWEPFSSGKYTGYGRWGLYMEPAAIQIGFTNAGNNAFRVVGYNADSSYSTFFTVNLTGTTIAGTLSVSGAVTIPTPTADNHAATKLYVDTNGGGVIAGTGLTKTGSTLSVNAAQTQITSVGTLTGLSTSGTITATQTHGSGTTVNQLISRFDANWGMRLVQNYAGAADIYYQWYNSYNAVERLWLTVRNDTTTLSSPFVTVSNTLTVSGALTVNNNVTINPATPTTLSGFKVELAGANFSVYRTGSDTFMQNTGSSNLGTPNVFRITNATAANSSTSGALQVAGGASVVGSLYAGGLYSPIQFMTYANNSSDNLYIQDSASITAWSITGKTNYSISRYNTAGAWQGIALNIDRTSGVTTLSSLITQRILGASTSQNANDLLYIGSSSGGNVFLDREGGGTFVIGYNTAKVAGGRDILQIYNNLTDRAPMVNFSSAGTSSGSNVITMFVPVNMNSSVSVGSTVSFNNVNTSGIRFLSGVTVASTIYEDGNLYVGTDDALYLDCPIGTTRLLLTTSGATLTGTLNTTGIATLGSSTTTGMHTIQSNNAGDLLVLKNYNSAAYSVIQFTNHDNSRAGYFGLGGTGSGTRTANKMYLVGSATEFLVEMPLVIRGTSAFDTSSTLYLTNGATEHGRNQFIMTGRVNGGNDGWNITGGRNIFMFNRNTAAANTGMGDIGSTQFSIQHNMASNELGILAGGFSSTNPPFVMDYGGNITVKANFYSETSMAAANYIQVGGPPQFGLYMQKGTVSPEAGFISFGDTTGWFFYFRRHTDKAALQRLQANPGSNWENMSDLRMKQDVQDLSLGLTFLNKIKPSKFRYKSDVLLDENAAFQFGMIAQQVVEALESEGLNEIDTPLVSKAENEDMYYMSYTHFIPILIKSVKDLSKQVEDLKRELDILKQG